MLTEATIEAEVPAEAPVEFARLSGDWNRLHTDPGYAAGTPFGRPVLHGAYLTGLVSQLAGMRLPGESCLLHTLSMRFIAPVLPPIRLTVWGKLVEGTLQRGRVAVRIIGSEDGVRYADGHYDFGSHEHGTAQRAVAAEAARGPQEGAVVLVTGATGDLGRAVLERLGERGIGISRARAGANIVQASSPEEIEAQLGGRMIAGIVHCGWPHPDNEALTELTDAHAAVEHHLAAPIRQAIGLAQLLRRRGTDGAALVLVGSTAAEPGRHNYRMPLYTLAKSQVPILARILATELAASSRRCMAVVFDVIEGGMNRQMSAVAKVAHKDRSPFGRLPSPQDAAAQLLWALDNESYLASGATLVLTGSAAP